MTCTIFFSSSSSSFGETSEGERNYVVPMQMSSYSFGIFIYFRYIARVCAICIYVVAHNQKIVQSPFFHVIFQFNFCSHIVLKRYRNWVLTLPHSAMCLSTINNVVIKWKISSFQYASNIWVELIRKKKNVPPTFYCKSFRLVCVHYSVSISVSRGHY